MAILFSIVPKGALKQPTPFKVKVPQSLLDEFRVLLKYSKIPAPTYESLLEDGKYGVSHKWLTDAKEKWLNDFDWRKSEETINSFPSFKSVVTGENNEEFSLHFLALFSEREDAVPIMINHGWPGSFLEAIPLLTLFREQYTPQTLPYHIIVTSMPGFGFSTPPSLQREMPFEEVPAMFNQLMLDLGFGSGYVAQGGDIGSRICRILAAKHDACKAIHVNFAIIIEHDDSPLNALEKAGELRGIDFQTNGTAYLQSHRTRPSTTGLILSSSPLALLAWIGEKFLAWSDEDPPLHTILESVMLYWLTEGGAQSLYPYRQTSLTGESAMRVAVSSEYFVRKPLGHSYFAKEIAAAPRSWVEKTGNVVFYRQHEKGGHFAMMEQPELMKNDLEEFVKQVWKN